MNPIDSAEAADLKKGLPRLTAGDTVRVHVRVKESTVKEEIKGILIARLHPNYIEVDDFSIIDFEFAESFERALKRVK